ncbi:zinc-dependent metalloprotease [Sphingomonas sp.]|uniref:zinc-dependent metalloprotease n=1 Tax=Sphingomonas sp. TaxID=28214 RepID=UPI001ED4D92B|nr:zinc-dependent metalloprotease [Sphingomonas sp.]MBX3594248.1 zinc-dependent metalloprotease [Sphingomonas sp.]
MRRHRHLALGLLLAAAATPAPVLAQAVYAGAEARDGLLPVHVDDKGGRILVTLPAPGADGIATRLLFTTSLRTGLGAAPTFLDRGRTGPTQILAFRRIGKKVAIQFENPRFRAAGAAPLDPAGSGDFATSVVWMTDIAATLPDGRVVIDLADFLTTDQLGIAQSLNQSGNGITGDPAQGEGKGFRLDGKTSAAIPASVKVFPRNFEIDAIQTFASDQPGAEVSNIAPEPTRVSFTVHMSFVALPEPGFTPRAFDPRTGGFSTQLVDFGAPLGADVVRDFANRFRLEKVNPGPAPSRVKQPIVYYVDTHAPQPIRAALIEGIGWWKDAFTAAGLIDAFEVRELPADADPLDVRYNVVNWDDRATRGWSYGQEIVDPRTGEIVKGMVVLGSLRARQDIQIFQGLVGAAGMNGGGPNDPVRVAIARLRQLAAHEVGHTLGFAHNFAASTQDRASVMDYPHPRIGLVDGRPDLSDAYGVGVGAWDRATVAWLYGASDKAAADAIAAKTVTDGMRFVHDGDARSPDTAQRWGGLWDDGADPITELPRIMAVRRAALDNFGLGTLSPGEPTAELRRRFVPIWLLHRYEVVAAAKAIGGADFSYSVNGGGKEAAVTVPAAEQRAALDALLATLSPDALRVPPRLIPLLSAPRNGSDNRQYEIEVIDTARGPLFDPLAAADVAAEITLRSLLAAPRLTRLSGQQAADPAALGVGELLDRLIATTVPGAGRDPLRQRIAYRTLATLAARERDTATSPEVAALIDGRLTAAARTLAKEGGDWATSLSTRLLDRAARATLGKELQRATPIPPADPIGDDGIL